MPTHRLEGQNSIRFLVKDLKAIDSQLADMHVLLLVKVHFFHLQELDSLTDRLTVDRSSMRETLIKISIPFCLKLIF